MNDLQFLDEVIFFSKIKFNLFSVDFILAALKNSIHEDKRVVFLIFWIMLEEHFSSVWKVQFYSPLNMWLTISDSEDVPLDWTKDLQGRFAWCHTAPSFRREGNLPAMQPWYGNTIAHSITIHFYSYLLTWIRNDLQFFSVFGDKKGPHLVKMTVHYVLNCPYPLLFWNRYAV